VFPLKGAFCVVSAALGRRWAALRGGSKKAWQRVRREGAWLCPWSLRRHSKASTHLLSSGEALSTSMLSM